MAKRQARGKSGANPPARSPADSRQDADLASAVSERVQIKNIFAVEFRAKRTPSGISNIKKPHMKINVDIVEAARTKKGNHFNVRVRFNLKMLSADDLAAEPALLAECCFLIVYALSSFEGIDEDALAAFAKTSGVFNAWPFFREFVHNTCGRMSLPIVTMPTFRLPK